MAIGVYITFKVLDLADLTVDGTMCTGGAVCIMLMTHGGQRLGGHAAAPFMAGMTRRGWSPACSTPSCGIPAILAGILTQLALCLHEPAHHGRQGQPGHQPRQV